MEGKRREWLGGGEGRTNNHEIGNEVRKWSSHHRRDGRGGKFEEGSHPFNICSRENQGESYSPLLPK